MEKSEYCFLINSLDVLFAEDWCKNNIPEENYCVYYPAIIPNLSAVQHRVTIKITDLNDAMAFKLTWPDAVMVP